eukprot:9495961-Pyramimonas_sp.AAC.1
MGKDCLSVGVVALLFGWCGREISQTGKCPRGDAYLFSGSWASTTFQLDELRVGATCQVNRVHYDGAYHHARLRVSLTVHVRIVCNRILQRPPTSRRRLGVAVTSDMKDDDYDWDSAWKTFDKQTKAKRKTGQTGPAPR